MNIQVDSTSSNLASAMLNWKIRPGAVVGYGVKIFHLSPPNYVTRSPGSGVMRTTALSVNKLELELEVISNEALAFVGEESKIVTPNYLDARFRKRF